VTHAQLFSPSRLKEKKFRKQTKTKELFSIVLLFSQDVLFLNRILRTETEQSVRRDLYKLSSNALTCSKLTVSGDDRKSGGGTSGIWLKNTEEGLLVPYVPRPRLRSFPLTESLEQASDALQRELQFFVSL